MNQLFNQDLLVSIIDMAPPGGMLWWVEKFINVIHVNLSFFQKYKMIIKSNVSSTCKGKFQNLLFINCAWAANLRWNWQISIQLVCITNFDF